jgi:transcriptional regulator with XRE-family HTH domain
MQNLKHLRQQHNLSQQKLADCLHLSQQTIYKYENGLAEPDFGTLTQMADFFQTSVDYLIGYSQDSRRLQPYVETALNDQELSHLRLYRAASNKMKTLIDELLIENKNSL